LTAIGNTDHLDASRALAVEIAVTITDLLERGVQ